MESLNRASLARLGASFRSLKWYEWLMAAVMVGIAAHAMVTAFTGTEAGGNPPWLTVVNFISAVAGVFCVFFCAKASVSTHAFGLVNTAAYIVYLWYWHIWGTMCLELFLYLPMGVVGWIHWARHRDVAREELTVARRLSLWQNALVAVLILAGTLVYHRILLRAGGNVALWDAATVAIGIAATALQTLRYREQYYWWLVTDVVAVIMYIERFDPVYLTKKSIYLIVAVIGLINWLRLSRRNEANL